MPSLKIPALSLLLAATVIAQADPTAVERQQKDLERKESRELQKVDQAEEQERIKLRAFERDELAKLQRDMNVTALNGTVAVAATGSYSAIDATKLAQHKFLQDELNNLVLNQRGAEMATRFNRDRKAINRKYSLERAKLDAAQVGDGEDAAKQRDQAMKIAEVTAKYQEQFDNLDLEQETESAKLRYSHTTKINAAERDLAALMAKQLLDQANKGAAAIYNPMADPAFTKLSATRDEVKNSLETAFDELRAKLAVRRTDISNALDDEKAKITGG